MAMSEAYKKAHREIAMKSLRRVMAEFSPSEIAEYLSRFSKIELDGWKDEHVTALEFLFNDMERSLHFHHREGRK